MKYRKFTIAGGNTTALILDLYLAKERNRITEQLLKSVEQVGFIDSAEPSLRMMGDELCINATLAAAMLLGGKGKLKIMDSIEVPYNVNKNTCTISIDMDYCMLKSNTVLFGGIGYIFVDKALSTKELSKLAKKYSLPAFGSILVQENQIFPRVYVKAVNSCVDETSCGSGSIAAAIIFGLENILQPSGGVISVKRKDNNFIVTAIVEEIIC